MFRMGAVVIVRVAVGVVVTVIMAVPVLVAMVMVMLVIVIVPMIMIVRMIMIMIVGRLIGIGAAAFDVMVVALLLAADFRLEAQHLFAVLAEAAIHVVLADQDLLDPF